MWSIGERVPSSPAHGPHQVLNEEAVKVALAGLLEAVRELCLREHKHRDLGSIIRREVRDGELEQIADYFYLKGREAVCDFLRQHRTLIPILIEVHSKFNKYFGIIENHRACLEVFVDTDEDSKPKLFALALVSPSPEVSTQLDRLDQEWWLEQPYEVRRLMNIDVEYVDGSV